jgi:hypothetical protein
MLLYCFIVLFELYAWSGRFSCSCTATTETRRGGFFAFVVIRFLWALDLLYVVQVVSVVK